MESILRAKPYSHSMTSRPKVIAEAIVKIEPRFRPVIAFAGLSPIGAKASTAARGKKRKSNFYALATSILSQQLSTKAAATITLRVIEEFGAITPGAILEARKSKLRQAGVSAAKVRALKELAEFDRQFSLSKLHNVRDDEEIFRKLLPIFGIGRWTVEMFLIFQLGREDIWPTGDLGVRRGWEKVHRMRDEIDPKALEIKGELFRPYRSHLAWYCWRATEMK
jgi:DNA-3-methyladenine glycosylase II